MPHGDDAAPLAEVFAMTQAPWCARAAGPLAPALAALAFLLVSGVVRADDFVVYSPYVTKGQTEFEIRGFHQRDGDPTLGGLRAHEIAFGHAFTQWWRPELYLAEYQREPGRAWQRVGNEFENIFQLTPQGEYWADVGLLLSYERRTRPQEPNALEFGPLLEKKSGRFDQRLNLIWEKQVGGGANNKYAARSSYRVTYALDQAFAPGIEAYLRPSDHSYQAGPIVAGELLNARGSELEYRFGLLFGLNGEAPNQTLLAQLEYEFY